MELLEAEGKPGPGYDIGVCLLATDLLDGLGNGHGIGSDFFSLGLFNFSLEFIYFSLH
jgi:hypothetical protein